MRDGSAVFKNTEDFFGADGKVIFVTFVDHDSFLEADHDSVVFLDRINSISQLDHRKTVVDRVAKEDA